MKVVAVAETLPQMTRHASEGSADFVQRQTNIGRIYYPASTNSVSLQGAESISFVHCFKYNKRCVLFPCMLVQSIGHVEPMICRLPPQTAVHDELSSVWYSAMGP